MSMAMLTRVLHLHNPLVSRSAHKLLLVLAYHTNETTGLAYPGHRLLANECLLTERRIITLLHHLEKLGLVEIRRGQGRGHLSVYRLHLGPDEVIHRKGEISTRHGSRKGEILRPEKVKFCVPPLDEVEPRAEHRCAGIPRPGDDKRWCDLHRCTHFAPGRT